MYIKINSTSTLPDNIFANNNAGQIAYLNSVLVHSNVAGKTLTLSYAGGSTITVITTEVGARRYNISGSISSSNVGKDIQVNVSPTLESAETINIKLDIDFINS